MSTAQRLPRAGRWCFTINNYTDDIETQLHTFYDKSCSYLLYGREVGESGTPHLQGYFVSSNRYRLNQLKTVPGLHTAHLEIAIADHAKNIAYCSKGGDIVTYGEIPISRQGARTDLASLTDRMLAGESVDTLRLVPSYIRYYRHLEDTVERLRDEQETTRLQAMMAAVTLRDWQSQLVTELLQEPHERRVYWYYDRDGNSGKTFLSKYLVAMHGAIRFENGKSADIKYAYKRNRIVLFDFSRSQSDHINYEIIESIKNGTFFSTKYESRPRAYITPHVVVFSNSEPDRSKLSMDRWYIREIGGQDAYSKLMPEVSRPRLQTAHTVFKHEISD